LPLLACLDAMGDTDALRAAVLSAQMVDQNKPAVIFDRFTLRAILLAKMLTGRLSNTERVKWREWVAVHKHHAVSLAAGRDDPMPGFVHVLSEVYLGLKAFPRFVRSTPRTGALVKAADDKEPA
jgi:D-aspartate ligase